MKNNSTSGYGFGPCQSIYETISVIDILGPRVEKIMPPISAAPLESGAPTWTMGFGLSISLNLLPVPAMTAQVSPKM